MYDMVELTEREERIILIKFLMHNDGPFGKLPMDTRELMLASSCKLLGFDYDKDSMLDLGHAILDVQKKVNTSGEQFMNANKDMIKEALKHMTIDKFKKLTG